MSIRAVTLGALAASSMLAVGARAQVVTFAASLTGAAERPTPTGSLGTGSFTMTLNTATGTWSGTGSYSGLTSTASLSHIHGFATTEGSAPPVVDLVNTGGTSGTLFGSGMFTPTQVTNFLAGLGYVNVHSTGFPDGEIRGQLIVPTPGAFALLGLGGAAMLRRRR